jgi:hypothetical protein
MSDKHLGKKEVTSVASNREFYPFTFVCVTAQND